NIVLSNQRNTHVAQLYFERKVFVGNRELSFDSAVNAFLEDKNRCVILNAPIGFGKTYTGLNLVYQQNQQSSMRLSLYADCAHGSYDFATNFILALMQSHGINDMQMQEIAEKYQIVIF